MENGVDIGACPQLEAITPPDTEGDCRLYRHTERRLNADEWSKSICIEQNKIYDKSNKLDVVYGDIKEDHLIKATLSDDEHIQISLLKNLFEACGLDGINQHKHRAILIKEMAALGPKSERERNLLYHRAIANHLAMWCARGIFTSGPPIPTALAMSGMFQKLSDHYITIDDKLARMRAESAIREGPIVEHSGPEGAEVWRLALAPSPDTDAQGAHHCAVECCGPELIQDPDTSSAEQPAAENPERDDGMVIRRRRVGAPQ